MAKILLMEDEADQLLLFTEALEDMGYNVVCATSGVDALGMLKSDKFDLLITDIFVRQAGQLTNDGGLSLMSRVRNQMIGSEYAYLRDLPILAISGGIRYPGRSNLFRIAASMGADVTLGKPVDFKHLHNVIEALLNGNPIPDEPV